MITIFENRCVLKFYVIVLIHIFNTTYKGGKQVEIYMWALHHKLVLFQQSRNFLLCTIEWNGRGYLGLYHVFNHTYGKHKILHIKKLPAGYEILLHICSIFFSKPIEYINIFQPMKSSIQKIQKNSWKLFAC